MKRDEIEETLDNLRDEKAAFPATKTVLVLGAGASHGSSLASGDLRPPLIRSFFDCANKLDLLNNQDFRPLWDYLQKEGGVPFVKILELEAGKFLNIEQVYSLISELDNDGVMERTIERFVYQVLTSTTRVYKDKTCEFHDALLRRLQPEIIISFNYDLIIDRSLSSIYPGWEDYQISKFDMVFDGEKFVRTVDPEEFLEKYLSGDYQEKEADTIRKFPLLFKLHGSLNHYYDVIEWEQTRARKRWVERRTDYIVPLQYAFDTPRIYQKRPLRDYAPSTIHTTTDWVHDHQKTELKLDLIPPVWNKTYEDWDSIINKLRQAKKIVFIGYSMADIDLWVLRMFRVAYQRHNYKNELNIEVVGKSQVLERVRSIYYESAVENPAETLELYVRKFSA